MGVVLLYLPKYVWLSLDLNDNKFYYCDLNEKSGVELMHNFWKAQFQIWHHQKENAVSDGYWLGSVDSIMRKFFNFCIKSSI